MSISRRAWIGSLSAFALMARAEGVTAQLFGRRGKRPAVAAQLMVYVGAKGIFACRFDAAKGQLSELKQVAETINPSFFAAGPARGGRQVLYVANEGNDAGSSAISSWTIDRATGGLQQIGKVTAGFAGPCYVSVDGTGHSVYSASYAGGGVCSYRIQPDGTLSEPVARIDFRKAAFGQTGPNKERQDATHPHSATISPDNRFLIVDDLGNDEIALFSIDAETGRLGEPHLFNNHRPGSGPRHVAFHTNGRWMYGICELDSKIDQYLWMETHGAGAQALLTNTNNTVSTLVPEFRGSNTAAEISVGPGGYHVYASNRGDDSLVMFTVDQTSGALTMKQRISCGGKTPRQFTLDPSGRWLLCANQGSGSVTVFARNGGTGELSGPVQTLAVDAPTFYAVRLAMFARVVRVEWIDGSGEVQACPVKWIDNFAMRNFTNDAIFDDTLPVGDGVLEVGNRVPLGRLREAMEDWFRRKGYLKADEMLRVREERVSCAEPVALRGRRPVR